MERIDLSPKNDACVFLLVPSCNRATKCELTTVDGELLPSVYSLTVWRDKKVFTIHITDKENVRFVKQQNADLIVFFFFGSSIDCPCNCPIFLMLYFVDIKIQEGETLPRRFANKFECS